MPHRVDVGRWRERAEEARTAAMSLSDEHARRVMLGIAERYERLVQRAEKEKTMSTVTLPQFG